MGLFMRDKRKSIDAVVAKSDQMVREAMRAERRVDRYDDDRVRLGKTAMRGLMDRRTKLRSLKRLSDKLSYAERDVDQLYKTVRDALRILDA